MYLSSLCVGDVSGSTLPVHKTWHNFQVTHNSTDRHGTQLVHHKMMEARTHISHIPLKYGHASMPLQHGNHATIASGWILQQSRSCSNSLFFIQLSDTMYMGTLSMSFSDLLAKVDMCYCSQELLCSFCIPLPAYNIYEDIACAYPCYRVFQIAS
jgi:hypothetical protein